MKKTEQKIKSNLYALLPQTDSLKATKILVMLIHCYRIIKNFVASTSKLKKHLGETVTETATKSKNIPVYDLDKYTALFQNINTDSIYTPERQTALISAIKQGKAPQYKSDSIAVFKNTRNTDHKAITPRTHIQQIASNINSLLNGKSNNRYSVHYRTTDQSIEEFAIMLNSYLTDEISLEEMKKYISTTI